MQTVKFSSDVISGVIFKPWVKLSKVKENTDDIQNIRSFLYEQG